MHKHIVQTFALQHKLFFINVKNAEKVDYMECCYQKINVDGQTMHDTFIKLIKIHYNERNLRHDSNNIKIL